MVEKIPFLFIFLNVDRIPLKGSNQPLHQSRSIDESEGPVGKDDGGDQFLHFFTGGVGRNITDPLSWQGEVLGMRSDSYGMRVVLEGNREFDLVKDDPAIGFIGNEIERPFHLPALLL